MKSTTEISKLVKSMERNFTLGTNTSKYVRENISEDIDKIYAYVNSKYLSGEFDNLGREKPFFNIVTSARNIYYRATDIDTKSITIKPTRNQDVIPAFIGTLHLREWMNKNNFGIFLNKLGMELATFNSAIVKKVESKNKLTIKVVPWGRLLCDVIDFDNNPKVEILQYTPEQLSDFGYDKRKVSKLKKALTTRKTQDGQSKDMKAEYIEVYEIHGNLPKSYLTKLVRDENTYVQQMHVISFLGKDEDEDVMTLYSGIEDKDPYTLISLLPSVDGSISLNGSVKSLFQAQWMMNHTVKSIKDQMDIASKMVFQTSDPSLANRNAFSSLEHGSFLLHQPNQPVTQLNNVSHDIGTQESFGNMWKGLSQEITGVSESMMGQTAPSGTAWRQVQAILNESHSLFDIMKQNKGLAIEGIIRESVIPHLKRQMNTSKEIFTTLEQHDVTMIDSMYVPYEAVRRHNNAVINAVLNKKTPPQFDQAQSEQDVNSELSKLGNQRPFKPSDISTKTWKGVLKDLEWRVDVNIVGESSDTQEILTTLSTALQAVANPNFQNNPQAKLILSKILQKTGEISPLELSSVNNAQPQQPAPQQPAQQPQQVQ